MPAAFCVRSVFLQRKRVIVSVALHHESHSHGASWNSSKKLWQFPPEQVVQTDSELESIVLKLDQIASKMERQIDQLHKKSWSEERKYCLDQIPVPSGKLLGESPPASAILSISSGQHLVCRVKVRQVN